MWFLFCSCRVNCLRFVVRTDKLSLEGIYSTSTCFKTKPKTSIKFKWTVYRKVGNKTVVPSLETLTGFNKQNLVLQAGTLKMDAQYEAVLNAALNGFSSRSFYQFNTSKSLYGGYCKIT